ncbi:unnamed protein product [Larinioides sclopetarius]|uniref:Uncharacterized protein n=1 Tax=Larinioides sclopetarius TaxID=280406 RepID=A0AAV2A7E7_9ARAC
MLQLNRSSRALQDLLQPIGAYNSRHSEHMIKNLSNRQPQLSSCVTHSPFLGQEKKQLRDGAHVDNVLKEEFWG